MQSLIRVDRDQERPKVVPFPDPVSIALEELDDIRQCQRFESEGAIQEFARCPSGGKGAPPVRQADRQLPGRQAPPGRRPRRPRVRPPGHLPRRLVSGHRAADPLPRRVHGEGDGVRRRRDLAARVALQVHGAIGYTWECDLHFFMKRTWALSWPGATRRPTAGSSSPRSDGRRQGRGRRSDGNGPIPAKHSPQRRATLAPVIEDPERCYQAAPSKDARFDGWFFAAVTSTGIYCRPSCPARTPRPAERPLLRRRAAAAQQAGSAPACAAGPTPPRVTGVERPGRRRRSGDASHPRRRRRP